MAEGQDRNRDDERREKARSRIVRIVCYVLAALFAAGAVACIAVYAAYKLDVLFIPMALCAVGAMISFTYARVKR